MGNVSIEEQTLELDISVQSLHHVWQNFSHGKSRSKDFLVFWYCLENELVSLHNDLKNENYHHGRYRSFMVTDRKRRHIQVASMRDRVVHRLLYEYLVNIFDHTFFYDVWSCRKGKGLLGAIERTQEFFRDHRDQYVWRADIKKFFDHVDHVFLKRMLARKVRDPIAIYVLHNIVDSYCAAGNRGGGDTHWKCNKSNFRQYLSS